jgi:hypothetical protein
MALLGVAAAVILVLFAKQVREAGWGWYVAQFVSRITSGSMARRMPPADSSRSQASTNAASGRTWPRSMALTLDPEACTRRPSSAWVMTGCTDRSWRSRWRVAPNRAVQEA